MFLHLKNKAFSFLFFLACILFHFVLYLFFFFQIVATIWCECLTFAASIVAYVYLWIRVCIPKGIINLLFHYYYLFLDFSTKTLSTVRKFPQLYVFFTKRAVLTTLYATYNFINSTFIFYGKFSTVFYFKYFQNEIFATYSLHFHFMHAYIYQKTNFWKVFATS